MGEDFLTNISCVLPTPSAAPPSPLFINAFSLRRTVSKVEKYLDENEFLKVSCDCVECGHSPRLLLDSVLESLNSSSLIPKRSQPTSQFLTIFRSLYKEKIAPRFLVLVLSSVDRLPLETFSFILRLTDILGPCICPICISEVPFPLLFSSSSQHSFVSLPMLLTDNSLSRNEAYTLLNEDNCPVEEFKDLYSPFLYSFLQVFFPVCQNIAELRKHIPRLFSKYVEPVRNGDLTCKQTTKLNAKIQSELNDAVSRVYERKPSIVTEDAEGEQGVASHAFNSVLRLPRRIQVLIIATFLAGNNPARTDSQYFSVSMTRKKRRTGRGTTSYVSATDEIFTLERLLMIISFLSDEKKTGATASLFREIATLRSMMYLIQVSALDSLNGVKFRSRVPFEMARVLARNLRIDITHYMYNR